MLNADTELAGVGKVQGYNMFQYCFNNPVMMSDPSGHWPTWGQIFTAAAIVVVAAVLVVAVVATAGTAGALIGAAAGMYLGASAATSVAVATVATIGAYVVAAGIGVCGLSDAGEVLTGNNIVRDNVMGGNQGAYDTLKIGLAIVGQGIVSTGSLSNSSNSNKYNKKQQKIIQIAKDAKREGGISRRNAEILVAKAQRAGFSNARIDEGHPTRNGISAGPHMAIGKQNHIQIFPD